MNTMAEPEVSEEWQVDCPELKKRAICLFQTKQWADCTFRFRGDSCHGDSEGILNAHSLMLAMASPVFAAQFFGSVADRPEFVDVQDIKMDIFSQMLRYIYTDGVKLTNIQTAMDLYYAAKKYFLHFLKKEIVDYLIQQLNPGNVCEIYEFSCFYDESGLKQQCLQMISEKTIDVLHCSRFEEAKLETIEKILSMEPLNIRSEVDLLKALLNYAKKYNMKKATQEIFGAATFSSNTSCEESKKVHSSDMSSLLKKDEPVSENSCNEIVLSSSESSSSRSSSESESDSDEETRNKAKQSVVELKKRQLDLQTLCNKEKKTVRATRRMLRKSVKMIRFLTMTPRQFAECRQLENLLKKDEIIAISTNIALPGSHIEMPKGFSTSTSLRNKRCRTIRSPGGIRIDLPNMWKEKKFVSETFIVGRVPWKIRMEVCPSRSPSNSQEINIYLRIHLDCLLRDPLSENWTCKTTYKIKTKNKAINASAFNIKSEFNFTNKAKSVSHTRAWMLGVTGDPAELNTGVSVLVTLGLQERATWR